MANAEAAGMNLGNGLGIGGETASSLAGGLRGRRFGSYALGLASAVAVESLPVMTKAAVQPGARGGKLTQAQIDARAQQRAEDDELIREAQRGQRAAFDALVRRYDQSVLRLALHMLGNEHNQTFVVLYSLKNVHHELLLL